MNPLRQFSAYFCALFQFSPKRFILSCLLTIFNSFLSGIGLLLLVPLLQYAGWLQGAADSQTSMKLFTQWLPPIHGHLPLLLILLLFLLLIAANAGINYWQTREITSLRLYYLSNLRKQLNNLIARAKWSYLLANKTTHLENMMSSGILQISGLTYCSLQMISDLLITIIYLAFSFVISWRLTLLTIVLAILLLLMLRQRDSLQIGQKNFLLVCQMQEKMANFMDGLKLAKSYNNLVPYMDHFAALNTASVEAQQSFFKMQRHTKFLFQVFSAGIFAFIFYSAVMFFHTSVIALLALLLIFSRLLPRVSALQQSYGQIINLIPAFSKLKQLTGELKQQQEKATDELSLALAIELRFEQVCYRYGNYFSLNHISFSIPINTTIAIVGHSGAGKSTLADLLLGLLDPTQGSIYIDAVPLSPAKMQMWRKIISYVPQEAYLFNASIRDNLLWANETANEQELWLALKQAAIADTVAAFPNQLDTLIGDHGWRLSGGERQRLALARALLRKPQVLLLDEATSSLDARNEKAIYQTLKELHGKITIIIITHRVTTIHLADNIIVLERGSVVEVGTPAKLFADTSSYFYQLFACGPANLPL
jgi:ATP-binding cassette subfamily C protein